MLTGLFIAFYFIFPLIVIRLINKYNFLNRIGSIVIVYIIGIIIGNIGLLPPNFLKSQDIITSISIPLAIPLLIFSFDIRKWLSLARSSFLSLLITILSVVSVVVISSFIFNNGDSDYWKISGMLVGVYTGGTPNLAAIKTALNVDSEIYILTHTFDMFFSSVYLLFLMLFGQKIFGWFLPKYKTQNLLNKTEVESQSFQNFYRKENIKPFSLALSVSILIFAIAGGLSLLVPKDYSMLVAILMITSLGIAASFISKINKLKNAFDLGMYFILVFSLTVASMADLSKFTFDSLYLFLNIGFVIFGSIVLQLIFSRIFKIDRDTTIICSTALICSPPFVPVMAGALKNKEIIFSGLTIGIIGYAIGNYLGLFIAFLLKTML